MIIWAGSTKQNSKQWKGGTECNLARRVEGACINNGARLGLGLAVSGGACHLRSAFLVWTACMRLSPDARYASRRVGKPWTLDVDQGQRLADDGFKGGEGIFV